MFVTLLTYAQPAGTGSAADPYMIGTAAELQWFAQQVNATTDNAGLCAKLTADIDLSRVCGESLGNWTPIGDCGISNATYTRGTSGWSGTFDGDGHTISNLYVHYTGTSNVPVGLFGSIKGGSIQGLSMNSISLGGYYAGGVAGYVVEGMISNCIVYSLELKKYYNNASSVGCIVGYMENSTVNNCQNHANISTDYSCTGGIAGTANGSSSIHNCLNNGNISSTAIKVAGIVAAGSTSSGSKVNISCCSNSGNITTTRQNAGGIAGLHTGAYISLCSNHGKITSSGGTPGAGGIAGQCVEITNCYNAGNIELTSNGRGGGLQTMGSCTVTNCHDYGEILQASTPVSYIASYSNVYVLNGSVTATEVKRTAEEFSDGTVLGLLERGSGTGIWKQGPLYPILSWEKTKVDLTEDEDWEHTKDEDVDEVNYTRTFKNNSWQALYVPFPISREELSDEFDLAKINTMHQIDDDEDGKFDRMTLEASKIKSGTLRPNHPYLIRYKGEVPQTVTIKKEKTTLSKAEENTITCWSMAYTYDFTGTYKKIDNLRTKNYFFMSGGTLKNAANDTAVLSPFRWYMTITDRESQLLIDADSGIKIEIWDRDETGLITVGTFDQDDSTWDLSGRSVKGNSLPKIYIHKGKKILAR